MIHVLSRVFSILLSYQLTLDEMKEVIRLNKTKPYNESGACASHNYCDANAVMLHAFMAVYGRDINYGNPDDQNTINMAWTLTKTNSFYQNLFNDGAA